MLSHGDRLLLDQLATEYKIVQDKIDKIGSFQFTIRGWSITLVIASVFGVASSTSTSPYILLILPFIILAFFLMERKQQWLSERFGSRAFQIEQQVRRLVRSGFAPGLVRRDVGMTPRIAHDLFGESKTFKIHKAIEITFYIVQCAVVLAALTCLLYSRHDSLKREERKSVIEYHESWSPQGSTQSSHTDRIAGIHREDKTKETKSR
jgi:hypothetical protein